MILALALAALAFAGCGGGEDSGERGNASTSQGTAASAANGSPDSTTASSGQDQGEGEKQGTSSGAKGAGADSTAGPQGKSGTSQKQGPRIAPPKGPRAQAPTPKEVEEATVADISLQSPAIVPTAGNPGRIPAPYTCDGKGSWPELRWSGVPSDSTELILYAMSLQPVEGKLFVDWAVAGLDPTLTSIEAGKLPKGAVVGTNSFGKRGYEICPSGSGEIYMFALYALPHSLSPQKGFDARELRKEILDVSGNVGLLPAVYAHE